MMKTLLQYAGAVSAFFGAILLIFAWARIKDALDFFLEVVLQGRISEGWDAAAFLVCGGLLFMFALYTGVLGPHKGEDRPE